MERNELLGHLAKETVSTDEEIEVLGVEVNHHTRSAAGGADRTVESKLKPLHGTNVGAQHSLMIGVFSGEAGSVEEAEAERTIDGKRIFCTDVEGGSESASFVLLALVVEREHFFEIIADLLELVANLVGTGVGAAGIDILCKAVEGPAGAVGSCLQSVFPLDETEVGDGCADGEVVQHFVGRTEVESETEAGETEGDVVNAVNLSAGIVVFMGELGLEDGIV